MKSTGLGYHSLVLGNQFSVVLLFCFQPLTVFYQVKEFDWLPTSLPRHCRIILSTSRADLTYRSLCDRGDVEVVTLPGVKDNSLIMSYLKTVVKRHALPFVQTRERYVSGYAVFQVW